MRISIAPRLALAVALLCHAATSQAVPAPTYAGVRITEVLADNRDGLQDADGLSSDWIELFNDADVSAQLVGCQLRSSSERVFTFPLLVMEPHSYLLVWASGKGRATTDLPLHTPFKLKRSGGQLCLHSPDGALVSQLKFHKQAAGVSSGLAQIAVEHELLSHASFGHFQVAEKELPEGWALPGFAADDWHVGAGGFGFDLVTPATMLRSQAVDIGSLVRGHGTSVLYRFPFDAGDLAGMFQMPLELRAIGGFVVYLNGVEVSRRRVDGEPKYDSTALELYEERDVLRPLLVDLTRRRALLRPMGNVLAVHAVLDHKHTLRHLVQPRLLRSHPGAVLADGVVLFRSPTPGRANGEGVAKLPKQPKIKPPGALFDEQVVVTFGGGGKAAVLRYTLDGSEPSAKSPVCPEQLSIDRSCEVRARAFLGGLGGATTLAQFTHVQPRVRTFSSNLPLIVVSTGAHDVPIKAYTHAHVHAVPVAENGRASLADLPQQSCRGAIKIRGSSTLPLAKKGYGLEFRDRSGSDRDRALFGMPAASDWVLYAPHHWDQSHIRNALCYEIARRVGLAAPRCQFVELFVNDDGAPLSRAHYRGLYLLVEHVGIGKGRLGLEKLRPEDDSEPAVTGGYLFKRDRLGPGERGFEAGGDKLQFVEPREREITDAQADWLRGYLTRFGKGLSDKVYDDPERGYAAFLDVDAAIQFHLHQEFTNNPDAYSLSTYFHKPRGGKLRPGPVWDFDRAFRTNDATYWLGRAGDPYGWTRKRDFVWWGKLLEDPVFALRYRARGRELLTTIWAVDRMHALVDELVAEIDEAEQRDVIRWPVLRPGEWEGEIDRLKDYIKNRSGWMAAELLELPVYERIGDGVPFDLKITQGNQAGTLYYTTNGADPVLESLQPSRYAKVYDEPLHITGDVRVKARVKVGDLWSRRWDYYQIGPKPMLAISEVMYNPPGGRDYEFVEVVNYGSEPVDLRGLRLTGAVEFAFSMGKIHKLMPGQFVVVVQDMPRFVKRYDTVGMPVTGAYYGNLNNSEGDIKLVGSVEQEIARAGYVDDWLSSTDGKGYSLVAVRRAASLREKKDWQRSPNKYGSPGR